MTVVTVVTVGKVVTVVTVVTAVTVVTVVTKKLFSQTPSDQQTNRQTNRQTDNYTYRAAQAEVDKTMKATATSYFGAEPNDCVKRVFF